VRIIPEEDALAKSHAVLIAGKARFVKSLVRLALREVVVD
jgi:hypothetical protein